MRRDSALSPRISLDHRGRGAADQLGAAGDRDRIEEDAEVHGAVLGRRHHPALELADEVVDRLRPLRVPHHHVARAGGKAEALERAGEAVAEALQLARVDRVRQQEPVVLVGAHGLLAAPLRPITMRQPASRIEGGAISSNSLANRRRLRSEVISAIASTLTPCRSSRSTWFWMSAAARGELVDAVRPVDAAGNELRVAGDQAEDVDVLEDADDRRRSA